MTATLVERCLLIRLDRHWPLTLEEIQNLCDPNTTTFTEGRLLGVLDRLVSSGVIGKEVFKSTAETDVIYWRKKGEALPIIMKFNWNKTAIEDAASKASNNFVTPPVNADSSVSTANLFCKSYL